jgi:hypothetical protein
MCDARSQADALDGAPPSGYLADGEVTTMRVSLIAIAGLALCANVAGAIDAWDKGIPDDDVPASGTEVVHGSDEVHDLQARRGAADVDWYRLRQEPYSSYEVVVDGATAPVLPIVLERVAADGTTVLQASAAAGLGGTRTLRWENATANAVDGELLRVRSDGCATKCRNTATYRLRAYETTYAIPRFNNTGTQVTVVLLQNPRDHEVSGNLRFWNASGTQIETSEFTLAPKALLVLQTQTIVPDASGSVTVSHDGGYGELTGKSIALEPATGFSFDTPLQARPR